MTSIRVQRTYPHARAHVWRALTDPDLLARWLMPNDFAPVVGHRFTFRTEPGPGFDGIVHCEVREVEEPTRLVYTWVGGPIDTVIRFELEDVPGGTRLVVEQSGFQGVKAWLVSRILKLGNRSMYRRRLPALLDELARERANAEDLRATPPPECSSRHQGAIRRVLTWLTDERSTRGKATR
ncbi:MAG: SRPBCC domain-containing protein [Planctomycetes bacterium]|nr:SRPBCC domain-containing protein [Planctomycetota bacterium]